MQIHTRGRNKPKLPLVRRISDCQTCCKLLVRLHVTLVQVLVHFVGHKLDALGRQNSGQFKGKTWVSQLCCYFLSEVFELDIQHTSNKLISPKLSAAQFSDGYNIMQLWFNPIKPLLLLWIRSIWHWQRAISCDDHDVESSTNVERNSNDFSLRCTGKLQMLALTAFPATVNSFPFLACHSAVIITVIHINFVKSKRSQMLWVTII